MFARLVIPPIFKPMTTAMILKTRTKMLAMAVTVSAAGAADSLTAAATAEEESRPLRQAIAASGTFTALSPEATGVDFVSPFLEDHPFNYLYHSGFACGSVALGDVDGDGRMDIFFVSGPGENALYLQREPMRFENVAPRLGLEGKRSWGTGSALVDIDNDGDLDLYVCNYRGRHQLHVNRLVPDGELAFEERAADFGLDLVNASMTPAFADMDRDGDLDLFMLNNRLERPEGRPAKPPYRVVDGKPEVLPEFAYYYQLRQNGEKSFTMDVYGQSDRLYRRDGGRYVDVTAGSGIEGPGHGLSATWWDYNQDGYPDLYVGNDFTDPDRLYHNNRDGTFTEVLGETMPYCSWSSMGAASADVNNDGLPDFFSADMAATSHFKQKINMGDMSRHSWLMENGWPRQLMRNMLYINTGIHRFKEMAFMSGLARSDWTWAVKLADFDNDGWVDVFLSNGMARNFSDADVPMSDEMLIGRTEFEIYKDTPPMKEKNLAFRNEGGLVFGDVSADWGVDALGMSYGAAQGDLDGDGDVDLVVLNLGEPVSIYRNDLVSGGGLVIELRGTVSNRFGWGSTLRMRSGAVRQMRYHHPINGFQGCDAPEVYFGLGEAAIAESLTVTWPSGRVSTLSNLEGGRRYVISEPESSSDPEAMAAAEKRSSRDGNQALLREDAAALGLTYRHEERPHDDYAAQPLLPGKLSQLGPGLAWGDFDGDGGDDLFVGGAAGSSGALFRRVGNRFVTVEGPWQADRECEDMGVAWLDADLDGRLDLFVASGGVEAAEGSPLLADRLYLQREDGLFVRAEEGALPVGAHSSSAVTAADFDRDGDVDLFVGSRSVPGDYPLTPRSRLLRNESEAGKTRFVDVASAHGLAEAGLVTGATWVDLNDDGWLDLALVSEWGSPRVFLSEGGKLVERTDASGLTGLTGWWNSITAGDVDGDGDLDLVAGNVGLNTKYGQPSAKKPALLYYGQMDESGRRQLVEAKPGEEGLLPIRGRSCSSRAMPFLAEKFESYRSFASADLEAIYTPTRLEEAERFEATEFRSGVFRNVSARGEGLRFEFEPLPFEMQASPAYGLALLDVDGDGDLDLAMTGNLYTREPETGLWRGALGWLGLGEGDGTFTEAGYESSGFVVPGDGKSLGLADLDGDGAPDLTAVQNDAPLLAFVNRSGGAFRTVRLRGKPGNPSALGARVTLLFEDGTARSAQVDPGGGYLSQGSPRIHFGVPDGRVPVGWVVRWPDGSQTRHEAGATGEVVIELTQP